MYEYIWIVPTYLKSFCDFNHIFLKTNITEGPKLSVQVKNNIMQKRAESW